MSDHPHPSTQAEPDIAKTLQTLRLLEFQPQSSQRQISHALGLSLGKTHYLLHALLGKGLVKIKNFKRSDNKIAYAYLLTPKGMREKVDLTRTFLARKEAEFEVLRSTIAELRLEVAQTHPRAPGKRKSDS
jgi:EPS-associated MarR family transcriptional regulator